MRRVRHVVLTLATALALVAGLIITTATPASAAASLTAGSGFPGFEIVGTSFPVFVSFGTSTTPPDTNVTLDDLTLVPSCAGEIGIVSECLPENVDPGVYDLPSTATGSGACAGIDFAIEEIDAIMGTVRFTPSSEVTVPSNAACFVNFTVTVSKLPSKDAVHEGLLPGVQTRQFVAGTGTTNTGTVVSGHGAGTVTVSYPAPRPDGLVRDVRRSAFKGDGIYNLTGEGQTVQRKIGPGEVREFEVLAQNDRTIGPDQLVVGGRASGDGVKVNYKVGDENVTGPVTAGTYVTLVDPGEAQTIRVRIRVPRGTPAGVVRAFQVVISRPNSFDFSDLVQVRATVR